MIKAVRKRQTIRRETGRCRVRQKLVESKNQYTKYRERTLACLTLRTQTKFTQVSNY